VNEVIDVALFLYFVPLLVLTVFINTPFLSYVITNHFCVLVYFCGLVLFDCHYDMDHGSEIKDANKQYRFPQCIPIIRRILHISICLKPTE